LEAAVISIGRAEDHMVVLDDASVSGHHAEIEQTENGLILRDLGSTNGTKVNGSPVTEAVLNDGDQICFGSVLATIAASLSPKDQERSEPKAQESSLIQTTPPS
jgi:pSer/pThr/pTyr-binding forkhead associated (FHA) protein